jgi:transcriptional regulator with XRE-family HTH domain
VPTLGIDYDGLARLRALWGDLDTDKLLARKLDLSIPTVNRVLRGRYAPGPKFIAAVREAFGDEWAIDLFKVIDDE